MNKISIVIPAFNEEQGIGSVIKQVPVSSLNASGYEVEIIVVDNASTDHTADVARSHGAFVVYQPLRGYGNAYKAGFNNATGDIIVTGDADMTYPFDMALSLIEKLETENLDFLNTNRLTKTNRAAMKTSHRIGNWGLSFATRILFQWPYRDSQSGMWIFRRSIWPELKVVSGGMPFSQEIKVEAFVRGYRCAETPIEYRTRIGEVKLSAVRDGVANLIQLFKKFLSLSVEKKPQIKY